MGYELADAARDLHAALFAKDDARALELAWGLVDGLLGIQPRPADPPPPPAPEE